MGRSSFLAVVCVMAALGGPANAFHSALAPLGCRSATRTACAPLRAGARHQGLRGAVAKRDESMIKLLAHLVQKNSVEAEYAALVAFKGASKLYKAVRPSPAGQISVPPPAPQIPRALDAMPVRTAPVRWENTRGVLRRKGHVLAHSSPRDSSCSPVVHLGSFEGWSTL